jgi:hypothetical protein
MHDSDFLDQELEPLSSHKGPPDKPIEPEDMIHQKKLDIDAKMEKSILLNNPEAIEPQNLLKTEAQAKQEAEIVRDSLSRKMKSKLEVEKEDICSNEKNEDARIITKDIKRVNPKKRSFAVSVSKLESATKNEIRCCNKKMYNDESNFAVWKRKKNAENAEIQDFIFKKVPLERLNTPEMLTGIDKNKNRTSIQETIEKSGISRIITIGLMINEEKRKLELQKLSNDRKYKLMKLRKSGIEFSGKSWTVTNEEIRYFYPSKEDIEYCRQRGMNTYQDEDYSQLMITEDELDFMNAVRKIYKEVSLEMMQHVIDKQKNILMGRSAKWLNVYVKFKLLKFRRGEIPNIEEELMGSEFNFDGKGCQLFFKEEMSPNELGYNQRQNYRTHDKYLMHYMIGKSMKEESFCDDKTRTNARMAEFIMKENILAYQKWRREVARNCILEKQLIQRIISDAERKEEDYFKERLRICLENLLSQESELKEKVEEAEENWDNLNRREMLLQIEKKLGVKLKISNRKVRLKKNKLQGMHRKVRWKGKEFVILKEIVLMEDLPRKKYPVIDKRYFEKIASMEEDLPRKKYPVIDKVKHDKENSEDCQLCDNRKKLLSKQERELKAEKLNLTKFVISA